MISIQTSEGLQTKYPNQVAISVKAGQFASEKNFASNFSH